jgi:hypothetical protein
MYQYNPEKFTLVQCQETQEHFGIRKVYNAVFAQDHKNALFPCHKFTVDGNLEETPTVFKKRSLLRLSSLEEE